MGTARIKQGKETEEGKMKEVNKVQQAQENVPMAYV